MTLILVGLLIAALAAIVNVVLAGEQWNRDKDSVYECSHCGAYTQCRCESPLFLKKESL